MSDVSFHATMRIGAVIHASTLPSAVHQLQGRITEANKLLVLHKGGRPFVVETTEVRRWVPIGVDWCTTHMSDDCDLDDGCVFRPMAYDSGEQWTALNEGALDIGIVK